MLKEVLSAIEAKHKKTAGHNGLSLKELLKELKTDLTDEIRIALLRLEHERKIKARETKSGYSFFLNKDYANSRENKRSDKKRS